MQGIVDRIKKTAEKDIPKIVGQQKLDIIEAGGDYNGREPWVKNKKSTIRKKGHDKIWVESGEVSQSIALGDMDELPEYAEYVDQGTQDGHIPPRPLLNYTDRDMEEITRKFTEALRKELTS